MGSFPKREFKRPMSVYKCLFKYLCILLGLVLKKKIHISERVLVLNVKLRYLCLDW